MKNLIIPLIATFMLIGCQMEQRLQYPETKKVDTVDTYFGTEVPDPYRWLEDDNSEETKAWVTVQNEVTFGYLEQIPFREKIKERYTKLLDYPKVYMPYKDGGHYFVDKNDGLQNQDVIYMKKGIDSDEEVLILDPNTLSEDGTVALMNFDVSKDGNYFAYAISRGGSDWQEFFVRELETGNELEDHIKDVRYSGLSWFKDGFYYSRYPSPEEGDALKGANINQKLYYHKVGTKQEDDKLIFEIPDFPEHMCHGYVTKDEKFLIVSESKPGAAGATMYVKDLTVKSAKFKKIVDNFENDYAVLKNLDGKLFVMTNNDAPKYKLISIDVKNYKKDNWIDVIPEDKGVLQSITFVGGKIFANYLEDVHSVVKVYTIDGEFQYEVEFPTIGTVAGFKGDWEDEFVFYSFVSYTTPYSVYKYNIKENTSELYSKLPIDFNSEEYEAKQIFVESKDGTKFPIDIVHKKGIKMDGTNPTWIYGYGGFNVIYEPFFSTSNIIWLENGGIYVNAHIRGGGEYGEEWHVAGTQLQKQNVFDDFIASAEFMISENYTTPEKLAIYGGSNGGTLVGAVINQRPELYRVAFPAVGVMDMLRYQYFTIGRHWSFDYGTSEDSKEMFEYLYNYSPLHNIKSDVEYPAVMVTTADHDDRVVPAHSFKYAATLQATYKGNRPVIIRIGVDAGHGAGKPISKTIEEQTDKWSFAFYNMGITPKY